MIKLLKLGLHTLWETTSYRFVFETKFNAIKTGFSGIKTEFHTTQTDFNATKSTFSGTQTKFSAIKTDFNATKTKFSGTQTNFRVSKTTFGVFTTNFKEPLAHYCKLLKAISPGNSFFKEGNLFMQVFNWLR